MKRPASGRPAWSVLTKLSKQTSIESRIANAKSRFFAKFRRDKNDSKLPREVGAVPRLTNVDKDPTNGGNFGNSRDSTTGKVVLVQEKFK